MKLRHLTLFLVVLIAIASCMCEKPTLSDKLAGKWGGENSIEITMINGKGNTVIQELVAPIEIEYLADSTFTAVIAISDYNKIKVGGNATFTDSTALLSGSLSTQVVLDFNGIMSLNEDGTLNLNYSAENSREGLFYKGETVANRIK